MENEKRRKRKDGQKKKKPKVEAVPSSSSNSMDVQQTNMFAELQPELNLSESDTESDSSFRHKKPVSTPIAATSAATKSSKPPPIIVDIDDNLRINLINKINAVATAKVLYTSLGAKFRVQPGTLEDFSSIKQMLSTNNDYFYSFSLPGEKPKIWVLRGIFIGYSVDTIKADLVAQGLDVIKVVPMTKINRKEAGGPRIPFDGYQVFFKTSTNTADLQKHYPVCGHFAVKWERPRNTQDVLQCRRCQRFGHGASNCHLPYRCVKCSNTHGPGECPKTAKDAPKCVNCGKEHTANYGGCETKTRYVARVKPSGPKSQKSVNTSEPSFKPRLNPTNIPIPLSQTQHSSHHPKVLYSDTVRSDQNETQVDDIPKFTFQNHTSGQQNGFSVFDTLFKKFFHTDMFTFLSKCDAFAASIGDIGDPAVLDSPETRTNFIAFLCSFRP